MKAVIFAGGLGTRISEESIHRPKPMIEIGGKPILWHIMKILSCQGINEFIICCGYKGYMIKEYFLNYLAHASDLTIDLKANKTIFHNQKTEPWIITMIDTGENSLTGLRLHKVKEVIEKERFLLTYGDGLANIDIAKLIKSHEHSKKMVTVTAVQPPGRFGTLEIDVLDQTVRSFREKPLEGGSWVNGGFFILEPEALKYTDDNTCEWESRPIQDICRDGELNAYLHDGFWHPMDTLRDKKILESLWRNKNTPWKLWGNENG